MKLWLWSRFIDWLTGHHCENDPVPIWWRMLDKHQWADTAHGAYGTTAPRCPECGGMKPGTSIHNGASYDQYIKGEGHREDCAIAEALR